MRNPVVSAPFAQSVNIRLVFVLVEGKEGNRLMLSELRQVLLVW